jgi:hypothetical protein
MPAVQDRDFSKLLAGIPRGSWVALSHDQDRVISYDIRLEEAIKKAKNSGESDPVVIRVPDTSSALFL